MNCILKPKFPIIIASYTDSRILYLRSLGKCILWKTAKCFPCIKCVQLSSWGKDHSTQDSWKSSRKLGSGGQGMEFGTARMAGNWVDKSPKGGSYSRIALKSMKNSPKIC